MAHPRSLRTHPIAFVQFTNLLLFYLDKFTCFSPNELGLGDPREGGGQRALDRAGEVAGQSNKKEESNPIEWLGVYLGNL